MVLIDWCFDDFEDEEDFNFVLVDIFDVEFDEEVDDVDEWLRKIFWCDSFENDGSDGGCLFLFVLVKWRDEDE